MSNTKLTYEEIKQRVEESGCILLSEDYINSKTKMSYVCKCGETIEKTMNAFSSSPYCKVCIQEAKPKSTIRKKYTTEEVKLYFLERGCEMLSEDYVNTTDKIQYICECGRKSEISFDKFRLGRRCRECANERVALQRTIPFEQVKEEFESTDYILLTLEKDYESATQPIYYLCPNGHEAKTTFSAFKSGVRCRACLGFERHTFEYVKERFEEGGCVLLEEEYVNAQTKMKYECECGNTSEINYNNFYMGKRCDECARGRRAESSRIPFSTVKELFEENGSQLLTEGYVDYTTPIPYICKCGREGFSSYATFRKSKQCKQCSFDAMKSPNSTGEMKIDRRHIEGYKDWVKDCYKRDNYVCQCCSQRGGKLNAHHKDGYHWCVERRIDPTNSVTLCKECHTEFHSIYGNKDNTEAQYMEFEVMKKKNE